jgi:hypothetical protein
MHTECAVGMPRGYRRGRRAYRVSGWDVEHVPRKLDDSELEAEAEAQKGLLVFTGIPEAGTGGFENMGRGGGVSGEDRL